VPSEIENVTVKTRDAAIELLVRFFREEGFATSRSRIAENFDRMLADPFRWSALAVDGETARAGITVSTVLYVEWGRLGEIGDLYVAPPQRPGTSPCRTRQGLVSYPGLLGGLRHHHASRRAAA
jgi:hypothetical protein